jgi:hypothetical protein
MMSHIRNLEQAVRDFEAAPGKDHAALAAAVQQHLRLFVAICTMQDKAHDELHKWLAPLLSLTDTYTKAGSPKAQEGFLREVKRAMAVFHEHFTGATP